MINEQQLSAEFYVYENSYEYINSTPDFGKYEVVRNGSMRLHHKDGSVIRYTTDLFDIGIETDEQLGKALRDETLEVIENPWFEVWNIEDPDEESEVYDDLKVATRVADHLQKGIYR